MKRIIGIIVVVMILTGLGVALISLKKHSSRVSQNGAVVYHCPMHPTYVSDRPGDCPICGMRLVLVEQNNPTKNVPTGYRHPMDPNLISPVPKKDEMGMDYVPIYESDQSSTSKNYVLDRAPIALSEERRQLIGVRTAVVERQYLESLIRASGRVAFDPDLYNAIIEYRQALQGQDSVKDSPWPDVKKRSEDLVRSSAFRLRQMGFSAEQISRLAEQGHDPTNLLLSEKGGTAWIYAQIYEVEAALVKAGQKMDVQSPAFPGQLFSGTVVAVDSILNPETRTLRVRGEVPNKEGILKPEMFVEVVIHVALGRVLALPEEAVLNTGTRQLVFVESSPGHYNPREVSLGPKAQGFYRILSGLKEGERVVISANFFIDSESKLKASLSENRSGHSH